MRYDNTTMETRIAVIDMKAFYSFVECVERGVNPFTTPLAVVDESRGEGTIVLSVSPFLKSLGVPSRCRKRDLPDIEGMIFATPRMSLYLKKSAEVVSIILDFVGEDDIHIYSVDELFINLGPYLKMYECTAYQLVRKIQKAIFDQTNLVTTSGIGPNMFMAKAALDLDGKKKAPYIVEWKKADIKKKLWPVTPLTKMWGISSGYEAKLNSFGIYSVGQLANSDKNFLKEKLGIIGEQMWEHANGIDNTNIRQKYIPTSTSFSLGQVLMKDYDKEDAKMIIKEMNDDLSMRLREHHQSTSRVSLSIGYTYEIGGGISQAITLPGPTDDSDNILQYLLKIFDKYVEDYPIRRIYISYSKLENSEYEQLSLFEDNEEKEERRNLQKVMDTLKNKYGKDIVLRVSSLLKNSTAKLRHGQIGGFNY